MIKQLITLMMTTALMPVHVAEAQTKRQAYVQRIKVAPVTDAWSPIINYYTGGSYGIDHLRLHQNGGPRGRVRQPILDAAVHYHIPFKLLIGIWGAESGWGAAWNNFGLIGPATGELRHDAFYAARLFNKFYRSRYGHNAVR